MILHAVPIVDGEVCFKWAVQSNWEVTFFPEMGQYEIWLTASLNYAFIQYLDELVNKGGHLLALVCVQLTFLQ